VRLIGLGRCVGLARYTGLVGLAEHGMPLLVNLAQALMQLKEAEAGRTLLV
jgi:hypothetical protein